MQAVLASCLAVVLSLLSASPVVPASAAQRAPVGVRSIAPGVTYQRITDPDGPWVVHVVRVDPSKAAAIDLGAAGPTMGAYSRPSEIGSANGAVVAINGDFGLRSGQPLHPFLLDGSLKGRGIQNGVNFAVGDDEDKSFVGPERLEITGAHRRERRRFTLSEWNSGRPEPGEIVAFTRFGGSVESPPDDACSARLKPDGRLRWGSREVGGVTRRFTVDVRGCQPSPIKATRRAVVIASRRRGGGARTIKAMKPGDSVRLSWSFGWPKVLDSIGGMPQLVAHRDNVAGTCASYFCKRNPRTGVGVTGDGTVLLVVVDGRSGDSVGMTLIEFARTFLSLGAVKALNLDGGGSAAMWIRGRGIVSDPSDSSGERAVVNAMLVLPHADSEEPSVGSPMVPSPSTPADASWAAMLAAADPGSTGGLADAWLRGELGMSQQAPPAIVRIARSFSARA